MNSTFSAGDRPSAHTIHGNHQFREISSKVTVISAYRDDGTPISIGDEARQEIRTNGSEFIAIWDTGASDTAITNRAARSLGLPPISQVTIKTPNGTRDSNVYKVHLLLNKEIIYCNLRVTEIDDTVGNVEGRPVDVLIGMDIISDGDFALTLTKDKSKFSFQLPASLNAGH